MVQENVHKHVTAMDMKMTAKIKKTKYGHLHGELSCKFFDEPFLFSNIMNMIEMMEITFDTKGFPERQYLPRAFNGTIERIRKNQIDLPTLVKERSLTHEQTLLDNSANITSGEKQKEKECTFEILVRFRHNAEWQGSVNWLEQGKNLGFSSIVELMKHIDNALME